LSRLCAWLLRLFDRGLSTWLPRLVTGLSRGLLCSGLLRLLDGLRWLLCSGLVRGRTRLARQVL
jgi:hypothetical protein